MVPNSRHPQCDPPRKGPVGMRMPVFVLLLLFAPVPRAASELPGRDVLLVEHPRQLTILDQFERTASAQELQTLPPYAPLLVLDEAARLSDGYTRCIKVRHGGQQYYVLTDDRGGLPPAAGARVLRDVSWLDDTVRLTSSVIIERPTGGRASIGRGALVERFFEFGGRGYLRPLSDPSLLGWARWVALKSSLPVTTEETPPPMADSAIVAVVHRKIDESNRVLEQLYRLFDTRTRRTLATPRWQVSPRRGMLVCELVNAPPSSAQSERYLAKDIENALLGTGARVDLIARRITVYLP
jgi:hypothetical protein